MMNNTFYNNYYTELYHHGIKGQKWGIRRFQNEDGSLNYNGKMRYGNGKGGLNTSGKERYDKGHYKSIKYGGSENTGKRLKRAAITTAAGFAAVRFAKMAIRGSANKTAMKAFMGDDKLEDYAKTGYTAMIGGLAILGGVGTEIVGGVKTIKRAKDHRDVKFYEGYKHSKGRV